MCGRYSVAMDKNSIEYHFNAKFVSGQQEFHPTYNAAPSGMLPIIRICETNRVELARRGPLTEGESPRNSATR